MFITSGLSTVVAVDGLIIFIVLNLLALNARGTYNKGVGIITVFAVENILHNVLTTMFWFSCFSTTVPNLGLNFAMFAGEDTAAGIVTTFTIGITVAGIVAATSDDLTKTKELGATFSSEIENVVINIAELYKESLDNDAVIVTIPGCNNVTVFSLITALVKSEELYVHTPVLLLGLVGSTNENDGFVNDLFVISSAPT